MTTTETTRTAVEFETALGTFVAGCTKLVQDNMGTLADHYEIQLPIMRGPKFVRIVREERAKSTGEITSRSSHCFVEIATGNVLKSATWSAPAKHARGNIYNPDNGLSCMSAYGAAYLR